jgi:hypothetical protein
MSVTIRTKEEAKMIKHWRIDRGCSWRKVAELAAAQWPDRHIESGHQIEGRMLCDEAMDLLGEKIDDGWN